MERRELERGLESPPYTPEYGADGREVVDDGSGNRLPVVGRPAPAESREFTEEQMRKIGEVYMMMAEELPVEGRDYRMKFSFPNGSPNPTVSFYPITELGRDYVRHISRKFESRSQNGSDR